jgi:3-dehydrotetronate 4-kinase
MVTLKNSPLLGCIADDFTGASDLAGFLVESGMRTLQINSVPQSKASEFEDFDAIVIALKSRSEPKHDAVRNSLAALAWLQKAGCKKFYFKYCSTFDSTSEGNIGPVTDALLDALGQTSTIVSPALPVNGRTIYQGHLFVGAQPLHESPLKDHPVTPMLDASLVRLMEAQSSGKAVSVPYSIVDQGEGVLRAELLRLAKNFRYLIVDALKTEHMITLGHCCEAFKLVTGASGLATDLCAEFEAQGFVRSLANYSVARLDAPTLVLSGSCSAMTQLQVAEFKKQRVSLYLNPFDLMSGVQSVKTIMRWIHENIGNKVMMIYATAAPDVIAKVHAQIGKKESQQLIENVFAEIARESIDVGVRNIVVAGGETSGAVVKSLGITALRIGKIITPGVPLVQTLGADKINLALKSGNFGQSDFFSKAVEALSC